MELIDLSQIMKFGAALVFVVALMVGLGLVVKRIGIGGHAMTPLSRRRLKVMESLSLDARRRLVLIQRDNQQHLVILGPNGETVVETKIEAPIETTGAAGGERSNNDKQRVA